MGHHISRQNSKYVIHTSAAEADDVVIMIVHAGYVWKDKTKKILQIDKCRLKADIIIF